VTHSVYNRAARILLVLYLIEAAVLLILIGIYKAPAYDAALPWSKAGFALIAGAFGLVAAGWLLLSGKAADGSFRRRAVVLALSTNLLSGLAVFLLVEGTVRVAARHVNGGIVVGSVVLRPTWPELKEQSRNALAGTISPDVGATSFFVYDRNLGWTVGPNRRSRNGLYFSSAEGIRSGGPNFRVFERPTRFRVALVGDSHAFSMEVPFEESWGYYLQQLLGDDVQVANFGVNGYGIDQMYLRYERDVRSWNPQVVVIGFVGHDLWRTMAVYPFVTFGWPGYLVKPRFVMDEGEPRLLNIPLPAPDEILSTSRIESLPFIQYDLGYGTAEWDWRFDHGPLFLRFLISAAPQPFVPDPRVSEEAAIALNGVLLARLVRSIEETGAIPILVILSESDDPLSRGAIARSRASVIDGTKCWSDVPVHLRRVPGGFHQSGLANEAVARCTTPPIEGALRRFGFSG